MRLPGAKGLTLVVAGLLAAGCSDAERGPDAPPPPGGAVSTATPEATDAAIRVLAEGGNAVDAAVAAAMVLGVTEASESGLGGHAVMLVVPPGGEPVLIHAPGGEPLAGEGGRPSLAPPTTLPVLGYALESRGSGDFTWERLVEPAERIAREGWTLGRYRHRIIVQEYPRLLADTFTASLVLNADRSIPTEGSTITNERLATTLRAVAEAGPGALGSGSFAADVADVLEARGYPGAGAWLGRTPAATATAPATGTYRDLTVLTAPDPYGGPAVLRALALLEGAPPEALRERGLPRTAWLAEALAWSSSSAADPGTFLAGLPPLPVPVQDTLGEATPGLAPRGGPPSPGGPAGRGGGGQTTHVSVVDGDGMAVALTLSLGRPFGAGFAADALGFFPGVVPADGYRAGARASDAAPGSAAATAAEGGRFWAVPTVVLRDGEVQLALGSPGGPRAVSAVVQVLAAWAAGDQPLQRVVEAPRIAMEADSTQRARMVPEGVVWIDSARSTRRVLEPFGDSLLRPMAAARGIALGEHDAGPFFQDWDPWFGGVQAVARTSEGWEAAADPRRDGDGRAVDPADVVEATGEAPPAAPEADAAEEGGDEGGEAPVSPGGAGGSSPPDSGG